MNLHKDYDHLFKIILIGNADVGKTSLLQCFADPDNHKTELLTIGIDFRVRTLKLNEKVVKCQIWDTAGQERFKTITSSYYKAAQGIFLVYNINDRQSFEDLSKWIRDIKRNASESATMFLIGNQRESEKDRQISEEEGKEYAEKLGIRFLETSLKDRKNVEAAFSRMVDQLLAQAQSNSQETTGTRLNRIDGQENSKRCC